MDREQRRKLNQALAKAIAFQDHGKPDEAAKWANTLIALVQAEFGPSKAGR